LQADAMPSQFSLKNEMNEQSERKIASKSCAIDVSLYSDTCHIAYGIVSRMMKSAFHSSVKNAIRSKIRQCHHPALSIKANPWPTSRNS
jgi:hypothetical protein